MLRSQRSLPVLLATALAALVLAGCQAAPAAPTPTATPQPSPTPVPTATRPPATSTPMPSPTPPPTAAPKAATPAAIATRAPSAASPGLGQSTNDVDKLFAEAFPTMMAEAIPTMMAVAMPTVMAEAMPTLMAILPTAPPAPTGNAVTLSQADLAGQWQGWITIDAVTLKGATAEEQKACDDQLKVIKGRQIPTSMDFSPESATAGKVKVISEQGSEEVSQDEPQPYSYRSSTIAIAIDQGADGKGSFEGKTIQTATGYAITGTWKSEGQIDPSAASGGDGVISGTWVMRKPR